MGKGCELMLYSHHERIGKDEQSVEQRRVKAHDEKGKLSTWKSPCVEIMEGCGGARRL